MLRQAKTSPDLNNYLAYLCTATSNPTGLSPEAWYSARTAAAIMLKNNVKSEYNSLPDLSKLYIKHTIFPGLSDPTPQIRNYVGNVITEMVRQEGLSRWPEVLSKLVSIVEDGGCGGSADAAEGAMGALFKICEDHKPALDAPAAGTPPLAFLLPKLLDFAMSGSLRTRAKALLSITIFLNEPVSYVAQSHIDEILSKVVQLTTDPSEEVRRFVCRTFAVLADTMPEVLVPHVEGIVDYTLAQQKQIEQEELALDAAEFFFEASSNDTLRNVLGPYLDRIVPVLLNCMVYSGDDQLRLEGEEEDAEEEDEQKDIKPQFATAKVSRAGPSDTAQSNNDPSRSSINGYAYEDDGLSDGEIDEADLLFDPEDEWNLRKCSAAALDSLATHYGGVVFNITLPWLMDNLMHKSWPNREAAVLTLGAVGPGCMSEIKPHLPQLVPYMITLLGDPMPVVRQITCWALSRFAGWASKLDVGGRKEFFEPMMDGILQRMLDGNKKVQESAASAFAKLEEASNTQLTPYCSVIVQQFVRCFGTYQEKNRYILYDCVQTLAEHAGPTLAQPELVEMLMPALYARWQKVPDQSREMFPLLECLAFVATALGAAFAPFAEPFFMRCIKIIASNLEERAGATWETGPPDQDFLVTSLDLLSSVIQALDERQSIRLATAAEPNMFLLLAHCMESASNDVRQSAYALLGDCAIYIFPLLQQYLDTLMELVIAQLDLNQAREEPETAFRVINNACWSCGEMALRQGAGMSGFVERLLERLGTIMLNPNVPESVGENAAIALGRLGVGCHAQLAPHLHRFARPFVQAMARVAWTDEKGDAYRGFARVVLDNPPALQDCFVELFVEMAHAPDVFLTGMQADGPREAFELVLREYRRLAGEQWPQVLAKLGDEDVAALKRLYRF